MSQKHFNTSNSIQKTTLPNIKNSLNNIYISRFQTENVYDEPSQKLSKKSEKYSQKNIISTSDQSLSNQPGYFLGISQNNLHKKQMMELLNQNYKSQIDLKQSRVKQLKNQERIQERKFIERQKLTTEFINSKLQQKIQRQRNQALNDYQRGLQLKINAKLLKQEENRKQKQKYSKVQENKKEIYFKQFYSNNDERVQQSHLNYIQQVSPQLKIKQWQLQKIALRGIQENQKKYRAIEQQLKKNNQKRKQEFKAELKRQIQEKRIKNIKNGNPQQFYSWGKDRYSDHNTIVNPISYRVNPQNKYIVEQINSSRTTPNKYDSQKASSRRSHDKYQRRLQVSPLVRNGSQVLI